jgi:hypothetical protein
MKKELFSASASACGSTADSVTLDSIKQALAKFKTTIPPRQALLISKEDSETLKRASQKFNNALDNHIARGIPIFESNDLPTGKQVQRRTHRRSRINKKWRKRYGFKPPERFAYVIDPAYLDLNYLSRCLYKPNFYNFKE